MKRSQCALACGARVLSTCSDIESSASSTADAKMLSRSWTRKRYPVSRGRPFRNCWTVHAAVGLVVRFQCTTRLSRC